MQEPPSSPVTPKTPKKRAGLTRTQPQLWLEYPSKQQASEQEKLLEVVNLLTKRLNFLEQEWEELLVHLSGQEDSMESCPSEDEQN